MTETPDEQMATDEQLQQLRDAAPEEEFPEGMRASEAEQRLVELRSQGESPA